MTNPDLLYLLTALSRAKRKLFAQQMRLARDKRLPLSFAQRRIWFLDQLAPGNSLYRAPAALHMRGRLDVSALQRISVGKPRSESGQAPANVTLELLLGNEVPAHRRRLRGRRRGVFARADLITDYCVRARTEEQGALVPPDFRKPTQRQKLRLLAHLPVNGPSQRIEIHCEKAFLPECKQTPVLGPLPLLGRYRRKNSESSPVKTLEIAAAMAGDLHCPASRCSTTDCRLS
ncbi:MAG: hypothetical protein DMG09_23295 [Acidobacteria bacterium]|nr:MAG: hypothetical protein DMG09_23295 [Acidobacteriota bacterium]